MAANTRKRLRRPLPLVIAGDPGPTEGSILWMDGVDVALVCPTELAGGQSHRARLDLGDAGEAAIEIRVLSSRHVSTERGRAWLHDGVYRPADPADGARIEMRLQELGAGAAVSPHRARRRTLNPLSQVGPQAQGQSHSQTHSRRGLSSIGEPGGSSAEGDSPIDSSAEDNWPEGMVLPHDLDAQDEFDPPPSPKPHTAISDATPLTVWRAAGSTEYAVGRHVDTSISRPPEEASSPPFTDAHPGNISGSPMDALDPPPDLRARLADRARAAALAHARRRLAESSNRDPVAGPRSLAERSPVPRPPPSAARPTATEDVPIREAIRAGQLIRSHSQSGEATPDAPPLPHRGYQRPTVFVAPGSPSSIQLVFRTDDDVHACVTASGDGVYIYAPRHPDLQENEEVLMVVQLPNGAYLQFDARVDVNGPLLLVIDASEAPQGRIGPLLTVLRMQQGR